MGAYDYIHKPFNVDELKIVVHRRARAAPAAARERAAQARPRRAPPVLEHHRPQRVDAGGVRADRDDRADDQHRAGHGRVGHRQGAGRPRHPLQLAAQGSAVRRRQLRRADRDAARDRAVRPRARRLHRRRDQQEGPVRGRRARHDLPRRDRRDEPADAGQAAARAAGARRSGGSAAPTRSRSTSASSPRPTATWRRWWRRTGSARISTTGST